MFSVNIDRMFKGVDYGDYAILPFSLIYIYIFVIFFIFESLPFFVGVECG